MEFGARFGVIGVYMEFEWSLNGGHFLAYHRFRMYPEAFGSTWWHFVKFGGWGIWWALGWHLEVNGRIWGAPFELLCWAGLGWAGPPFEAPPSLAGVPRAQVGPQDARGLGVHPWHPRRGRRRVRWNQGWRCRGRRPSK